MSPISHTHEAGERDREKMEERVRWENSWSQCVETYTSVEEWEVVIDISDSDEYGG